MEIVKEINHEETDRLELNEDDLFYKLLTGETVQDTIHTSRGDFVVKYPKQKDLMYIDRRAAAMRGGLPAESFDAAAAFSIQKIAFLDVVIVSGEKWFEAVKKKNSSFSWAEVPDVTFIDEVYTKAWLFRSSVQAKLQKKDKAADPGTSDNADVQSAVGDGLFDGVA